MVRFKVLVASNTSKIYLLLFVRKGKTQVVAALLSAAPSNLQLLPFTVLFSRTAAQINLLFAERLTTEIT